MSNEFEDLGYIDGAELSETIENLKSKAAGTDSMAGFPLDLLDMGVFDQMGGTSAGGQSVNGGDP